MSEVRTGYCFVCKVRMTEGGSQFEVEDSTPAFNKKNLIYKGKCKKCGKKMSTIGKRVIVAVEDPEKKAAKLDESATSL